MDKLRLSVYDLRKEREMFREIGLSVICAAGLGILSQQAYAGNEANTGVKQSFDPQSVVFVTNRDSSDITVIDMKTNTVIDRIDCGSCSNPHMTMATMDGKRLITTGTQKNYAIIIDLKTMETRKVRLGNAPEHFMVSHDGGWAYVGNMEEGTVSIVDLTNGKEIKRIAGFYEPHGFSILPDMSKVYVANLGAHGIGVIDVKSQALVKNIYIGSSHVLASVNLDSRLSEINGIVHPTLTPDGRYIYAADGDSNQVAVIDTRTDRIIKNITVGENPWRAYMSPDGTKALVPNNGDQTVSIIDVKTNKVITTFPGGEGMTGVNFVNGGKKAYIISQPESALYVIDMEKYRELKRIKFGEGLMLETATTTPDGKTVYLVCSTNNSVYVIDGTSDNYTRIPDVGLSPWAVEIIGGNSYCH